MQPRQGYHLTASDQTHLQNQNALLDQLHNSVLTTRNYAVRIGTDIQEQDDMLDDLHNNVIQTADENRRQNRNLIQLLKESKNRGFYIAVLGLLAIIFFLLWI